MSQNEQRLTLYTYVLNAGQVHVYYNEHSDNSLHSLKQSHHSVTFAVNLPNNGSSRRFPLTVTEVL